MLRMLEQEGRRFPVIVEMLSRAAHLSDAEIEAAPLPLKWYRDALKMARDRAKVSVINEEIIRLSLLEAPPQIETSVNLKRGLTLEYVGDTFWARTQAGNEIEIRTGDWLFYPEDGSGAWLNQTFFPRPPMQLSRSKRVAEQTRHEYIISLDERLSKLSGVAVEYTEPKARFTISRM